MRSIYTASATAAALCLLLLSAFSTDLTAQTPLTFNYDGTQRTYFLHLPDDLPPRAPLVFVLHGYTSSASVIMGYSGMSGVADEHKFAVCYPQGSKASNGENHWNSNLTISPTDDVGFLTALAEFLQREYQLNANHTFACGMSNGGFMSYTLACERPDIFRAIASVTGTMSGHDWRGCDPSQAVPVFQISGSADEVVPINGSLTPLGGWGGAPGMQAVTNYWVRTNICRDSSTTTIDGRMPTDVSYYRQGINGNQVWQYLIQGWGHSWPFSFSPAGFNASEHIWQFFELVVNRGTVSTEELEREVILLSPNPASTQLSIQNRTSYKASNYQVINLQGQLLIEGVLEGGNTDVDISPLPQGVYFCGLQQL
ncbi:MAG: PHB depolymerase family esterase [Bacteroidota bacterium]